MQVQRNEPSKSFQVEVSDSVMKMINVGPDGDFYEATDRAGFLISAATEIAAQSCPTLTTGEWCSLAEVANSLYIYPEAGVEGGLHSLLINVQDSPELDSKWSVDCNGLVRRLQCMSLAEQLAVLEIIHKFWASEAQEGGTYAERFTRLGAPGLM